MSQSLQFTTTVLPGHRVEVPTPGLTEGQTVHVIVRPSVPAGSRREGSLLDFLNSLPSGPRAYSSWEEFEREFQAERDAWDR